MYKRIISLMLAVLLTVSLAAPGLTSAYTSSFSDSSGFSGSSSFSNPNNSSKSTTESLVLPASNALSSGWTDIVKNISVVDVTNVKNGNEASPFNDVRPGDWFFEAANYVHQNGLFNGTGENTFSPQGTMTRAMFVTVLGRAAGVDPSNYNLVPSFTDVSSDAYYAPYVEWANENGIVTGVGNRKFAPNDTVTREQMATMMVRYFEKFNINYQTENTVTTEPNDIDKVSSWAKDAILALWRAGLINGDHNGNFNPASNATRAEAASFVMRSNEVIKESLSSSPSSSPSPLPSPTSSPTSPTSPPTSSETTPTPTSPSPTSPPANKSYTITFDTDGGTAIANRIVVEGTSLGELPTAEKENYDFLGWFTDREFTTRVSLDAIVTNNMTLYARFKKTPGQGLEVQSIPVVSKLDQPSTFSIKVVDRSGELTESLIKNAIDFTSPSHLEFAENPGISIVKNNDEYIIAANNESKQFPEGGTFKLVLTEDALVFKEGATEYDSSTREFTFTTAKAEVNKLKFNPDLKFLSASDVSLMSQGGQNAKFIANSLYTYEINEGSTETIVNNYENGYFIYDGGGIEVGDTVVIYAGAHPNQRNGSAPLEDEGNISYVEIFAIKNGNEYHYGSPDVTNIIFMPDVLPVSVTVDTDGDSNNNSITVSEATMDFSGPKYEGFNFREDLKIETGDFIAFYTGELSEASQLVNYAEIKTVHLANNSYTITYEIVSEEAMRSSLDYYKNQEVDNDALLSDHSMALMEAEMTKEAIDSGFAQRASAYLAALALQTDSFKDLNVEAQFNASDIQYISKNAAEGTSLMRVAGSKVEVSVEQVKVNISNKLQHFKGKTGVRASLQIEAEVSIEVSEEHEIKIKLTGTFEQEFSVSLNAGGEIFWEEFWFIPLPVDYAVNVELDVFTYTGVKFDANLGLFEKEEEIDWLSDDVINVAKQIKKVMEEAEKYTDTEIDEISNGLPELYADFLDNEDIDWVEIVKKEIFKTSIRVVNGIFEVVFKAEFVVRAKVNISVGIIYTYENGQRYGFNMRIIAARVSNSQTTLVPEKYSFTFYAMGELGLKAGIRLTVEVGALSTELNSIGVQAELGGYIKLWGFFYYHYEKVEGKPAISKTSGAYYAEIGLYIDLKIIAQAFKGTFSVVPYSTTYEKPLLQLGTRNAILDFSYEQEDVEEIMIHGDFGKTSYQLPLEYFMMDQMDLTDGEITSSPAHHYDFNIRLSNEYFRYNPIDRSITPDVDDHTGYDAEIKITYDGPTASLNSKSLTRTYKITYSNLDDNYSMTLKEYDKNVPLSQSRVMRQIVGPYLSAIPKIPDPTKQGYTFFGWYNEWQGDLNSQVLLPDLMDAKNLNFYAVFLPAKDTPYLVETYYENVNDRGYTLASTEKMRGTTNASPSVDPKHIPGFITPQKTKEVIQADGSTVIKYYYKRATVELYFEVDFSKATGEVPPLSASYIEYMKYGERLNVPSYVTNIEGLTFLGWESIDEFVPAETKTYTAYFDVKKDMKVLVEFYSRDSYEEQFSKVGREIYMATAFTEFNARVHAAGYYNSPNEYALADDWGLPTDYKIMVSPSNSKNLVVKQYLDRKYELKFDLGGGAFTDNTPQIIYLPAENAYDIPPDPVREGYEFAGWSPEIPLEYRVSPKENTTFTAQWTKVVETKKYKVEHYQRGTGIADSFTLVDTEELLGAVGDTVTATYKTYPGFYALQGNGAGYTTLSSGVVKADGSTTLKLYYDRNAYTAKFIGMDPDTEGPVVIAEQSYRYGAAVTILTRYGDYEIIGWKAVDGGPAISSSQALLPMPARNVTYEATFLIDNTPVSYTVEHYIKGTGLDDDYTLHSSTNHTGKKNSTVSATAITIEGFTYEQDSVLNVTSGIVRSNDPLVLKFYYDRNVYRVKFVVTNPDTNETEILSEETYRFGAEFTLPTSYGGFPGPSYKITGFIPLDGGPDIPPYYASFPTPAQNVTYEVILGEDDGGGGGEFPGWPW